MLPETMRSPVLTFSYLCSASAAKAVCQLNQTHVIIVVFHGVRIAPCLRSKCKYIASFPPEWNDKDMNGANTFKLIMFVKHTSRPGRVVDMILLRCKH